MQPIYERNEGLADRLRFRKGLCNLNLAVCSPAPETAGLARRSELTKAADSFERAYRPPLLLGGVESLSPHPRAEIKSGSICTL